MTGECNCACMPVQNPLWPLTSPFLLSFPVFSSVVSILPLVSSHFSPWYGLFGLFVVSFLFLRRVFRVCVLFCLPGPSCFYFYCHYYDFFPLFVVHLCVRFVFLFQTDAALLVDSRSANANAEWNNKCVYSQCSCHLVYSGPLLKGMRPHWGLIRFQGDCRQPLRGTIYTAVWINNIIMTSTSYLLLLSGCSKLRLFSNGSRQWLEWSGVQPVLLSWHSIKQYFTIQKSVAPVHRSTHPECRTDFQTNWCAKLTEILRFDNIHGEWESRPVECRIPRFPSSAGSASSPALT